MEIRGAIRAAEVDAAYDLVAKSFGPSYFEASDLQTRVRALEPLSDLADAVVALERGEVIGFVRILARRLTAGSEPLPAGGITNVCVHPDYQGRRIGISLMEAALRRSWERGDVVSVLFARRAVDGWYPRIGYLGVGCHPELTIEVTEPMPRAREVAFQRGAYPEHRAIYARAYAETYGDLFLSFHRDEGWWEQLEARLERRIDPNGFVTVFEHETPIGYFLLRENKVIEASALAANRRTFLDALLEFFLKSSVRVSLLALSPEHWCVGALRRFNHTLRIRYAWDGGHMLRILNPREFRLGLERATGLALNPDMRRLFDESDVSDHMVAMDLLRLTYGADYDLDRGEPRQPLVPTPTWSAADEL